MYTISELVTPSRTGKDGRLKLVAALNMMQDCSEMWLDSEPQLKSYFQANNISQLLVSRQIDILRTPSFGENMTIHTSIFENMGVYGYRNTIIYDEKNEPCYVTWSTGAFLNHSTGRLAKLPPAITANVVLDPRYTMEYLDRKIHLPEGHYTKHTAIEVRKDDIDYNLHMNNAQYVRVANEFLPNEFEVKRLRIEYKLPAKYQELLYPEILEADNGKIYIAFLNEKGQQYAVMEFCG